MALLVPVTPASYVVAVIVIACTRLRSCRCKTHPQPHLGSRLLPRCLLFLHLRLLYLRLVTRQPPLPPAKFPRQPACPTPTVLHPRLATASTTLTSLRPATTTPTTPTQMMVFMITTTLATTATSPSPSRRVSLRTRTSLVPGSPDLPLGPERAVTGTLVMF